MTTNSLPVRDELEICDKKESAPKTAAKIEVIFKFAECPSAPVEEITEISEYVILSFEDFLQNFYEKLNLSGWSVFKDHKENNFFCLYQLKEQKNPIDVTFHCKVIIERSLEVHVMSHDPSVDGSTLIESFQLEHWWQLEQTLQQHNQHSLEVVEESQLENSEENIESNFIDDMIVVEETNSSISDQDVKEEYMEEEILEEIYLDTPKKVIELSEYKQMKEESTPVFKVPSTYTCEVCSEIFPTEQKYRKHHLTHNPIKQFIAPQKCPTCEKTFDELKKLKRHMAMCQVERRFLCDICCMKFKNKTALNSHLMRHNDANKVPCTLCGHRFFPG